MLTTEDKSSAIPPAIPLAVMMQKETLDYGLEKTVKMTIDGNI